MDNWVILIERKQMINVSFKSHLILSIPVIIVLCAFFRKIFRLILRCPHGGIVHVMLDTLGMFLSTNTSFCIRNRAEQVMNVTILFISIITSKWITAVVFNYMMAYDIDAGIDTLEELGKANVPLYISEEMKTTMEEWKANIE